AKTMDSAGPAACLQRVDDHRLAATLEETDRSEARDPGIKHLDVRRQIVPLAKPPEDMGAEAVVTLPGIPEADDVEHPSSPLIRPGSFASDRTPRSGPCRRGRRRATGRCAPVRRGSPGP